MSIKVLVLCFYKKHDAKRQDMCHTISARRLLFGERSDGLKLASMRRNIFSSFSCWG